MMSRGCEYFDHTDKSVSEWGESLLNSEVNQYTQLGDTTFINVLPHGTTIKRYNKGTVLSWFERNND